MNATQAEELLRVWNQIRNWPVPLQVSLARRILDSLEAAATPTSAKRGRPVSEMIGLGAGTGEPPTDEMVRQWIDEHRMEKYGS